MKGATVQLSLFIVIVLCGLVVSQGQGAIKMAAFVVGVLAAFMAVYHHWKKDK